MVWLDARASNGGIFGLVIEGFFFFFAMMGKGGK